MTTTDDHDQDGTEVEQDPLQDAEIGETVSHEINTEHSLWGHADIDSWVGFDRDVDNVSVEDATIVGEQGDEEIKVRLSADVTKREPPDRTINKDVEIDRPHTLWWFKTPISVTIGALVFVLGTSATAASVFPFWLAIVVVWMALSIASGAYPWSMRFGGL